MASAWDQVAGIDAANESSRRAARPGGSRQVMAKHLADARASMVMSITGAGAGIGCGPARERWRPRSRAARCRRSSLPPPGSGRSCAGRGARLAGWLGRGRGPRCWSGSTLALSGGTASLAQASCDRPGERRTAPPRGLRALDGAAEEGRHVDLEGFLQRLHRAGLSGGGVVYRWRRSRPAAYVRGTGAARLVDRRAVGGGPDRPLAAGAGCGDFGASPAGVGARFDDRRAPPGSAADASPGPISGASRGSARRRPTGPGPRLVRRRRVPRSRGKMPKCSRRCPRSRTILRCRRPRACPTLSGTVMTQARPRPHGAGPNRRNRADARQRALGPRRPDRADHGRAGIPAADVRAAARHLARTGCCRAWSRSRRTRVDAARQRTHAFIEAYMVGLNHEMARAAAVERVPDRPARQLLPAVLGRRAATCRRPGDPTDPDELRRAAQGHPADPPLAPRPRLWATTRTGRTRARPTRAAGPRRAAAPLPERGRSTPARPVIGPTSDNGRVARTRPTKLSRCSAARSRPTSPSSASTCRGRRARRHRRADRSGWFFVFQQQPTEPRFGLEPAAAGPVSQWNDLAWTNFAGPALASASGAGLARGRRPAAGRRRAIAARGGPGTRTLPSSAVSSVFPGLAPTEIARYRVASTVFTQILASYSLPAYLTAAKPGRRGAGRLEPARTPVSPGGRTRRKRRRSRSGCRSESWFMRIRCSPPRQP